MNENNTPLNTFDKISSRAVYSVSKEIVHLERDGEYIIFAPHFFHPAYFASNGLKIKNILTELQSKGDFTPRSNGLPESLFKLFVSHSLIEPVASKQPSITHVIDSCNYSKRRSVYLLLTQSCNQACIYCYNGRHSYQTEANLLMSMGVAQSSIRRVVESLCSEGELEIVFFGGEPLLNFSLAKKIIEFCSEKLLKDYPQIKISYHFTTNLTILPKELVPIAKEYNISFLVDIDGPEHIHNLQRPFRNGSGSFKQTVNNISVLRNANIDVSLRTTLTSHNHQMIPKIGELHKNIGGISSAFVPMNILDSDSSVLPYELCPSPEIVSNGLIQLFETKIWPSEKLFPFNQYMNTLVKGYRNSCGCGAPYANTPAVTTDGRFFSCIYLVGDTKYQIGDLKTGLLNQSDTIDCMKRDADVDNLSNCQNCNFRYLCGGGCPAQRYLLKPESIRDKRLIEYLTNMTCTLSKTLITELLWNWVRHYKSYDNCNSAVKTI